MTTLLKNTQDSEEEAFKRSKISWYLPHHQVLNINKPNKVCMVFDAAATFDGIFLNDRSCHGPDLTNNLVGVFICFREEETAFTADVEAMFHQVKVRSEDADALRFLWWDASSSHPPKDYQMLVHIFGATSSPEASPARHFNRRRTIKKAGIALKSLRSYTGISMLMMY